MDEAHTIWGYKNFRKVFKHIGKLRALFPDVPFLALSATLPPHVVAYIHTVCRMKTPCGIVVVNGRRDNINLLIAEQPTMNSFKPLLKLIPRRITNVDEIPKTLIFVDSAVKARRIALALRHRFGKRHLASHADPNIAIRTYYSSIDTPMKEKTISLINSGDARLTVCTDAMSLGVHIPDIERVIQWGVDEKLELDTLVQRIGRAARTDGMQGVAVVYAHNSILKVVPSDWKSAWTVPPADLDHPPGDPDDEWEDDEVNMIPTYEHREIPLFALPVLHETESQVHNLKRHMYRKAKILKNAPCEMEQERTARRPKALKGTRRKSIPLAYRIDPGVLWFLTTTGCLHRCILSYMDYPDVWDDHKQKSWCCDRCALQKGLDPNRTSTAKVPLSLSALFITKKSTPSSQSQKPPAAPKTTRPATVRRLVNDILTKRIQEWRQHVFNRLVTHSRISDRLPLRCVFPDKVIEKVVKSVCNIVALPDLRVVLQKEKFKVEASLLRSKDVDDLFNVIDRVVAHASEIGIHHVKVVNISTSTSCSSRE
jgi:superfamily II DNA/RNA helicase